MCECIKTFLRSLPLDQFWAHLYSKEKGDTLEIRPVCQVPTPKNKPVFTRTNNQKSQQVILLSSHLLSLKQLRIFDVK